MKQVSLASQKVISQLLKYYKISLIFSEPWKTTAYKHQIRHCLIALEEMS